MTTDLENIRPELDKPLSLAHIWEEYVNTYIPSEDDNPDNLDWYARYFASKSIVIKFGAVWEQFEHLVHQATCWGYCTWKDVLISLQHHTPDLPDKPIPRPSYECEPSTTAERIETRAREIFKREFKSKWPDKRINSKFAKGKWEEVKKQAIKYAQDEFDDSMVAYNIRQDERQKIHDKNMEDWQIKYDRIDHIRSIVEKLEQAE